MRSDAYAAASFLLRNSCLAHLVDSRILNDRAERIDLARLHSCALSSGEQIIVEAAQALYNGYGLCSVGEAVRSLDAQNYAAFVAALQLRRPECFTSNLLAGAS